MTQFFFATLFLTALFIFYASRQILIVITVQGNSMKPFLAPGDRILVRKRGSRENLRKGQVVIFRTFVDSVVSSHGNGTEKILVKRIVGLHGDIISAPIYHLETKVDRDDENCEIMKIGIVEKYMTWIVP